MKLFKSKLQVTLFIFNYFFNFIIYFANAILLEITQVINTFPYDTYFIFGVLEIITLILNAFFIAIRIKLYKFSFNIPNTISINKDQNLMKIFKYINKENQIWNSDDVIFSNQNIIIKYYGMGIYKKQHALNCLYIFKMNEEYFFVDFCAFSMLLISKEK